MMEPNQFDKLDKLADDVYEKFEELYQKGNLNDLKTKLESVCAGLGKKYSITINFDLDVFDEDKEKAISLVRTGLACSGGEKNPYRVDGSSTVHTYIVNGAITKVPHDYCPACWGVWDFKMQNTACSDCGVAMGKEIFLLLDTDICPSCEEGKVSRSQPKCTKCGQVVSTDMVRWG